jgi:predicted RNase H-like HicB family nuclease
VAGRRERGSAARGTTASQPGHNRPAAAGQLRCSGPSRCPRPEGSTIRYTVVLARDAAGAYTAAVPALRGCAAAGRTLEEALENVRAAIDLYRRTLAAAGEPFPGAEADGQVLVASVTMSEHPPSWAEDGERSGDRPA